MTFSARPFRRLAILLPILLLCSAVGSEPAGSPKGPTWARMEQTLVPVRSGTTRNAEILITARKNDRLEIVGISGDWVKVRVSPTLTGFVPRQSVSVVESDARLDPRIFSGTLAAVIAGCALLLGFLAVTIFVIRRRQSASRPNAPGEARQQNKIQLLFTQMPKIYSLLLNESAELSDSLRELGYQPEWEKNPDDFLGACKNLRPHLVLAGADHFIQVERVMAGDAQLINTPVIYLYEGEKPGVIDGRIRGFLPMGSNDRDLSREIAACMKKSPRRIQYSVNKVALSGAIRNGTIPELLQFLASMQKSGELIISSREAKGELTLWKGQVVKAAWQNQSEKALEKILELSVGTFEFRHRRIDGKDSVPTGHTETLLLQWAKNKDERDYNSGN